MKVVRVFGWFVLLLAMLLCAWGLALVLTAGQDEEGVRGTFGWILLVPGVLLVAASGWTLLRDRGR